MPTPANSEVIDDDTRSSHPTCPPELDRASARRAAQRDSIDDVPFASPNTVAMDMTPGFAPTPPPNALDTASDEEPVANAALKRVNVKDTGPSPDMMSPVSVDVDKHDNRDIPALSRTGYGSPSSSHDFTNVRLLPSTSSSFLRSGSKFRGTQQSERQIYDVQVEIKHVDLRESFLCGYLRIQGLTEDHPTLTTYFEGEIIGSKYSFLTKHDDWGSNDKVDIQHWSKFQAFKPFSRSAKKASFQIPDMAQRENIFMRWKEHFLVPNHRVLNINGASYEGFYYICFNQVQGTVNGIYFHAKSEKFQQLELKHVEDRGCFGAMEFR